MNNLIELLLLSLIGSVVALVGGVVFLSNKKLSRVLEENSIPFAAGILITISLLGMIPESMELIGDSALWILIISFFGAFLFEHFLFGIHHHECEGHDHNTVHEGSVAMVIVGDTIHNFIDGVAIGASFLVSPSFGLITAIATFLHEVPHEIADFGILLKAGWHKKNIILVNIVSALATVVGAFGLLLFSENSNLIGSLLAISAGIFLYLGAIDFLPRSISGKRGRVLEVLPLIAGIVVIMLILALVPHAH